MTINRSHLREYQKHFESNRELVEHKTKGKISWIYEQYHNGKAITIDDFRLLNKEDPEGCQKLMSKLLGVQEHTVQEKNQKKSEEEVWDYIHRLEHELKVAKANLHKNGLREYNPSEKKIESVQESILNVKSIIRNMNENEKKDMLDHLYEVSALAKQYEDEVLQHELEHEGAHPYRIYNEEIKNNYYV